MVACVLTWLVLAALYLLCAGQLSVDEAVAAFLAAAVGRPLGELLPDAARAGRVLLSVHPHGDPDASDALAMHRLAHVPPRRDRAWPL